MISLTGNVFQGLKQVDQHLQKVGVSTQANQHHFRGMFADFTKGAASALIGLTALHTAQQRLLPGARELQTELRNLRVEFREPDTRVLDQIQDEFTRRAFEIQLTYKVDQTEMVAAETFLKSQQWSKEQVLGAGGAAETTAALKSIFPEYQQATTAASDVSAFMKMFGLTGEFSRFGDMMSRAKSMGLTPGEVMHNLAYMGGDVRAAYGAETQQERWAASEQAVFGMALARAGGLNPSRIGTTMAMFMQQAAGVTPQAEKLAQRRGLNLWETTPEGKKIFRGFTDVATELERVYGDWTDSKKMAQDFAKLFGVEGKRVAQILLDLGKSSKDLKRAFDDAPSALERIKGLAGSAEYERGIAGGTVRSITDSLAQKMAEHEGLIVQKINELLPSLGRLSQSPTAQTGMAYGLEGLIGLAGLATVGFMGRGAYRGWKGLQAGGGLGKVLGLGRIPANLMLGEAIQKIDKDVAKVFVVNWPAGTGLGGGGAGPRGERNYFALGGASTTSRLPSTLLRTAGAAATGTTGLTGIAAAVGTSLVIGAATITAAKISVEAKEAKVGWSKAEKSLAAAAEKPVENWMRAIVESRVARGKREGWSDEQTQAEIERAIAAMRRPAPEGGPE